MNTTQQLEQEVSQLADQMSDEVLRRLLSKWDDGNTEVAQCLYHYVKAKIVLQRLERQRDHFINDLIKLANIDAKISELVPQVRKLRHQYYEAKVAMEGEHPNDCQCRGCNCLSFYTHPQRDRKLVQKLSSSLHY